MLDVDEAPLCKNMEHEYPSKSRKLRFIHVGLPHEVKLLINRLTGEEVGKER